MNRFITLLLTGVLAFCATTMSAQTDSCSWTQQANQGPLTPKSAKWIQYTLDSNALRIVLVIDSTDPGNYIYMIVNVPKYRGVGSYSLKTTTVYQYGNRSDQRTVCDYGSFSVTSIDPATSLVTAKFSWTGTANLQNSITLKQKITDGKLFLHIKPDVLMVPKPGDGVKLKANDDVTFKIYARDLYDTKTFYSGVEITFTHDGTAFDGEKSLKQITDNDGAATFKLHTREKAVEGDYTYKVKGKKSSINDSPELTVKFKIASTRYYYTKCAGVPVIEFDAGEGKVWDDGGGTSIIATGDNILLAGLLKVNGTISIDTSGGGARVSGQGDLYFDAVMLDGIVQPFYLYRGPLTFFVPSCDAIVDLGTTKLASTLSGGKLKSAKLRFLGDGVASSGASITCGMEIGENAKQGCNDEVPFGTVWAPNKKAELELTLSLLKGPTQTDFTASGTVKNFSPVASWCLKEVKAEYKSATSEISISGKGKSPLFEEVSAGVTFKGGTLNAFNADFTLANCIPVPDLPVCWKGGGIKVENLFIGNPIKGSVNAKFGPLAAQVSNLFEIVIEGGFEDPPAKVYGKITGNVLKLEAVSKEKPWQGEISGTGTLEFSLAKGTLEVETKLLHLGADYFYTGKTTFALGFKPISVFASLDGSLTFPKLSDDNAKKLGLFGKFINGYAPVLLGKAGGSVTLTEGGPNKLSLSYDMSGVIPPTQDNAAMYRALKDLAHGTMTVDLDGLPNPSAIEFDGGFKSLLTGWFSNVTKNGGVTQAADVAFSIPDDQEAFVAFIESGVDNLSSSLVDPTGAPIDQANPDGGVHYVHSADGTMTMWVIKNPKPGTWKLLAPAALPTDTFAVESVIPIPKLEISASVDGTNLVITWSGSDLPQNGKLAFYLDDTKEGNDGLYAGSATVKDNTVTIPLSDTSAPCTFTVMGVLTDPTASLIAHSTTLLTNSTMSFAPPENVQAVSDQNGNTTITWSPVTDGRIAAVVVYDADADTVVAAAYNFELDAHVTLSNTDTRHLVVRSVDKNGRVSCPTEAMSITTGVNDDGPSMQSTMNGITTTVRPHPVSSYATVDINGLEGSAAVLQVIDLTGRVVAEQEIVGIVDGTASVSLGTQNLANGIYVMSIRQGTRVLSHGLIVTH